MKSAQSLAFTVVLAAAFAMLSPQDASAKTVNIGGSGGGLYYPNAQTTLGLLPGDTVYVKAGTYSGFTFGNVAGTAAAPITVTCDPNAVFTTSTSVGNNLTNAAFVNFTNFRYQNYASRILSISGRCHDLLFQNYNITNPGDWGFIIYDSTMVFDGTKDTTYYNLKFDHIVVDGGIGSVIINLDWASIDNLCSMILDMEVSNCSFSNMSGGVLQLSKCFNYKQHDCTFSKIATANHQSMLYLVGYGSVYNNTYTQEWGDDMRAFPAKLNALGYNGPDAINRFYNNIAYEKRKFAMFEQNGVAPADIDGSGGMYSLTTSEISYNTLYRSRKVDYIAPLVDCVGPDAKIRHNLIIQPECDAAFNSSRNYVYQVTGTLGANGLVNDNNLTYSTFALSGLVDTVSFAPSATSPVRNASNGTVSYITTDHYYHARYVGNGDVGAVERQIAGDFNGDGYVDQADYTTWADYYGTDGSACAPGSRGVATGPISQADYTTWADNYGKGTPPAPITVSQADEPAVQAAPAAVAPAAAPKPTPAPAAVKPASKTTAKDALRKIMTKNAARR